MFLSSVFSAHVSSQFYYISLNRKSQSPDTAIRLLRPVRIRGFHYRFTGFDFTRPFLSLSYMLLYVCASSKTDDGLFLECFLGPLDGLGKPFFAAHGIEPFPAVRSTRVFVNYGGPFPVDFGSRPDFRISDVTDMTDSGGKRLSADEEILKNREYPRDPEYYSVPGFSFHTVLRLPCRLGSDSSPLAACLT